jgi:hypothetical protein
MMAFPPDSRTLVVSDTSAAGNEVILRMYQVDNLTVQREASGQVRRFICSVAFDPNSQLLAAVGWDQRFDALTLDSRLATKPISNFEKSKLHLLPATLLVDSVVFTYNRVLGV